MAKVAVVFFSSSGNTEAMANAIVEGAQAAGADVSLFTSGEFDASTVTSYDKIAFGCSAMGAEELDADEFEPMFTEAETKLMGKAIALFGSYGWGDGEWMRTWQARCIDDGAVLITDPLIINEMPDEDGLAQCRELGKLLA